MPGPASDVIDGFSAEATNPRPDDAPLTTGPVDDATGEFNLSGVGCGKRRVRARKEGDGEYVVPLDPGHHVRIEVFPDCRIWVTHVHRDSGGVVLRRYVHASRPDDAGYLAAKAQLKARLERSSAASGRRAGSVPWLLAGLAAAAAVAAAFLLPPRGDAGDGPPSS